MNQAIYDGFKTKLQEMFMTDRADLDFGIYRVMNLKRQEIQKFLDKQLLKDVERTLHENMPSGNSMSIDDMENNIFSHLTTFFSRYYDEGDFISARRYGKDDAYMIPYKGEEVKLHWANADQYYIKTAKDFRDYQFLLTDNRVIHFVLKDAQIDRNNNIPDKNSARRFRLWTEGDSVEQISETETIIYFTYELESSKETQKIINTKTLEEVKPLLYLNNTDWEIFVKHLTKYTSSNSFDYFIHKNLGDFLKRELDIYIKNEVLNLSNLNPTDLANQIAEINAMKDVGEKIIDFLTQIENFQKKLWLKKKFVIQSDYCITLDHIIDICEEDYDEELLEIIASNRKQIEEWKQLFKIDEIKENNDHRAFSEPVSVKFLKENPYLMVDTQFFDLSFKAKVLNSIHKIDEKTNGVLISSENFQALNILQSKYANSIKCAYYDPPYNTSEGSFIYKNSYQHSSWCSMLENRLSLTRNLLSSEGINQVAIDDYEQPYLSGILDYIYGFENRLGTLVIEIKPSGRTNDYFMATSHEYLLCYAKNYNEVSINFFPLTEEQKRAYSEVTEDGTPNKWRDFLRTGGYSTPEERPNSYYPIFYNQETEEITTEEKEGYIKILPIDSAGNHRVWRKTIPSFTEHLKKGEIKVEKIGDQYKVRIIDKIKDGTRPKSIWTGSKYDASAHGTKLIQAMFGNSLFSFPKAIGNVHDSLYIVCNENDIILDSFAGSGTTGHAVINLNREDNGNRKYILVEMGEYFKTVTKPRVLKAVYSSTWKNGSPVDRDGVSQIIKYIRLEQYEDTLDNLQVTNEAQQLIIDNIEGSFSESYKINNMLDNEFTESILNLNMFEHPFDNTIKATMYNESKDTKIDMVDTFNYLIGLKVNHIEYCEEYDYKLCIVDGYVKEKHVLVIWRDMDIVNNEKLTEFLNGNNYNVRGGEYDNIYVNGGNNIQNMATEEDHFKVELIEEVFMNKMFEA